LVYKIFHIFRWSLWSFVWIYYRPDFLLTNEDAGYSINWIHIFAWFCLFFCSGAILEITYRKLVWGGLRPPNKHFPAVICPSCPEHPWISLLNGIPEIDSECEIFCANGLIKNAIFVAFEDKSAGFRIHYSESEKGSYIQNSWAFRPTHWRYQKH
jgi:hypothetical protein